MWHVFRIKPLKVGLIEELFRLRSNPLSLANPGILRNAPLLFFVATALWIIPIATIYPPGALTIRNEPHVSLHYRNASILNPDKDEVFEAIDTACCIFPRGRLAEMEYKLSRPDIDFYYSYVF